MTKVNVKEARAHLSRLLDQLEGDEVVLITRKGKRVAQIVSPKGQHRLPSLKEFRASLGNVGRAAPSHRCRKQSGTDRSGQETFPVGPQTWITPQTPCAAMT